jgi:hypothetical protein
MKSRIAPVGLLPVVVGLCGCHSLTRIRLSQDVRSESVATVLELWVNAPGPLLSDPPRVVGDVLIPLVLYPLDKLLSLTVAVQAPFNPDVDLQWGPFGALAGLTLPWVTLIPYVYPPVALPDVELAPDKYAELMTRIDAADGVRGYAEIIGDGGLHGGAGVLHSVAVLRGEPPRTQLHTAREPAPIRPTTTAPGSAQGR